MTALSPSACAQCPAHDQAGFLKKLGLKMDRWDFVVALAGNPNTGKSTVFNYLTGLRQHTGNWPGKTVTRAEGGFVYRNQAYKLVDLPGTYSLLSASPDEEVARDFILFGQPHATIVVADATCLERNLNLTLQILQITRRAILCINLMDEARAQGIVVDDRTLARDLGIPVVLTAARQGEGMPELLEALSEVVHHPDQAIAPVRSLPLATREMQSAVLEVSSLLRAAYPELPAPDWVALRLLGGDPTITEALRTGALAHLHQLSPHTTAGAQKSPPLENPSAPSILDRVETLRWRVPADVQERIVEGIYAESARLTARAVHRPGTASRPPWQAVLDRLLTGRWTGFPLMALLFAFVLWLTIEGANIPSSQLAWLLLEQGHPFLKNLAVQLHLPWWLSGALIDGMYLATAWVVSVMLPPMAIFFPLFTLLEDFGYLPRVAFNLDRLFQKAGAHGKQALTMAMGYGCNAAGVTAARIIDSPRERLIAIVTNNFALCNGRWPTQILIATVFLGSLAPAWLSGLVAAGAVAGVTLLGIAFTFLCSWLLSRTVLRGEASTFSLELPPYRPPRFWKTLYTSLIDRTLFVLWRAIVFALPAGLVIWMIANIHLGDRSLALWVVQELDPFASFLGLNGVILLAYVIAIPANEIVIPTILMLTVLFTGMTDLGQGAGVMFETDDSTLHQLLQAGGWTTLTAINLMLFSLCHNPCSTTLYTIYKETKSWKWTALSALLPLAIGFFLCTLVAFIWRILV